MSDRGQHNIAAKDEERQREFQQDAGHVAHEKKSAHVEHQEALEANRMGSEKRRTSRARRATGQASHGSMMPEGPERAHDEGHAGREDDRGDIADEASTPARGKKTRGGTHVQHVQAGTKGGSRIRQLIELGYKYEEEHGIGPGRSERSKLSAQRHTGGAQQKSSAGDGEEDTGAPEEAGES